MSVPMSVPVVFPAPADIELVPDPINPDWIVEGRPQARAKRLAESADGTSSVVVWSCTPGRFEWHYAVDEIAQIISGEVFITDGIGGRHRLGPGDFAYFPAGSRSVWQVTKEVRKVAVCRHNMPRPLGFALRAWNKVFRRLARLQSGTGFGDQLATTQPTAPVSASIGLSTVFRSSPRKPASN